MSGNQLPTFRGETGPKDDRACPLHKTEIAVINFRLTCKFKFRVAVVTAVTKAAIRAVFYSSERDNATLNGLEKDFSDVVVSTVYTLEISIYIYVKRVSRPETQC